MPKSDAEFNAMIGVPASGLKNKGITKAILATIPEKGKGAASLTEVVAAVKKVDANATAKGVLNTLYVLRKAGKIEMKQNEKEENLPYYRKTSPIVAAAPAAPVVKK
jgi:hypothetical protein